MHKLVNKILVNEIAINELKAKLTLMQKAKYAVESVPDRLEDHAKMMNLLMSNHCKLSERVDSNYEICVTQHESVNETICI